VRKYKKTLGEIGLTYTQYIVMMVVWEEETVGVKQLGNRLYLDSGTLTPLLKKLEKAGLVTRRRDERDERNVMISVTGKGMDLREKAADIPMRAGSCISISGEEATALYKLLYKILDQTERNEKNE
jgi:DNA-binding MarR family transcriptional regulator